MGDLVSFGADVTEHEDHERERRKKPGYARLVGVVLMLLGLASLAVGIPAFFRAIDDTRATRHALGVPLGAVLLCIGAALARIRFGTAPQASPPTHSVDVEDGFCKKCLYALRGLPEPRCPECGTPFDPMDSRTFLGNLGQKNLLAKLLPVLVWLILVHVFSSIFAWGPKGLGFVLIVAPFYVVIAMRECARVWRRSRRQGGGYLLLATEVVAFAIPPALCVWWLLGSRGWSGFRYFYNF